MTKATIQAQLELICEGITSVINRDELQTRLEEGRPLRVKIGFDPTAPDIHLGHLVQLQKLRDFHTLGHQVIFLVGDFTAMIGDPTGKNETRPPLSREQVEENAATYISQVGKVLDMSTAEVRYNSEWLGALSPPEMIKLMSCYNVARLLEREDFANRYHKGRPITLHEFFYPLAQAYDSVALQADVELGGTDQTFNLMVGRKIQRDYGQAAQIVITTPLLVGTDGTNKMSKSLANYIAIMDEPREKVGKIMSIADELMWDYFKFLRLAAADELQHLQAEVAAGQANPRDIKLQLAERIVTLTETAAVAKAAREAFIAQFSQGQRPQDIAQVELEVPTEGIPLANLMKNLDLVPSTSEALRLIKAGAVSLDGESIAEKNPLVSKGREFLLKVGKRRYSQVKLT